MLKLRNSKLERVPLIGHRGAPAHAPENTMRSFQTALEQGAYAIELDIHMSRDGELVVIHEFTVDSTTNGSGYVKDMTLAELKELDAGSWFSPAFAGERIPALAEVLEWARGKVGVAIEIKSEWITYPGLEETLVNMLRAYEMLQDVFVISFDHGTLVRVKELAPNVMTGALYSCRLADAVAVAQSTRVEVMQPPWIFASCAEAKRLHDAGLMYAPWGANEPESWRTLIAMGVDALIADNPEELRRLLEAEGLV